MVLLVVDTQKALVNDELYNYNEFIDNHEEAPIGCRRSATSLRTASSWKMPTMAAPRALAS